MVGMNTTHPLEERASEVVDAAWAFHAAAEQPGSYAGAPEDVLESLNEALGVLGADWHRLRVAGARSTISPRRPTRTSRIGVRGLLPSRRLACGSRGLVLGGLWLRCLTRWRASALDRRLADGADPMQSDALSLRVAQLGSAPTRTRLAGGLRGTVEIAGAPPAALRPRRVRRSEVQANSELLLELAERVGSGGPLGVRGLAMASLLVTDASSPLYRTGTERSLRGAAFDALVALERGHRTDGTTVD